MTTTIHRQIGRLGKRSTDDVSVAMLIREINDAEVLLGKLVQHTKAFRDAWTGILVHQTTLTDTFHEIYKTIPTPGDMDIEPVETSQETLRRVATLHAAQNDLKIDMLEEANAIDRLVEPLTEAKAALKPVKKAIEKREHKKLDYERFCKQVESSKAKAKKTDRDNSALARAEAELERSTTAYENADNHLKDWIPDLLAKIMEFLPYMVASIAQTQYTLLQHSYSVLYEFANNNGFSDPEGEVVIGEWEALFLSVQQNAEMNLSIIAKGKAVTMPMDYIHDDSIMSKVSMPVMPTIGRGKKPPPPPPPANPPGYRERDHGERSIGRKKSSSSFRSDARDRSPPPPPPLVPGPRPSGSIRSRTSNTNLSARGQSPPSPMPGQKPGYGSVRSRKSNTNLSVTSQDEYPPPPLPGPRPSIPGLRPTSSNNGDFQEPRATPRSRSFGAGSYGGTATPLAGMTQASLRPSSSSRPDIPRIRSAPHDAQEDDHPTSVTPSSLRGGLNKTPTNPYSSNNPYNSNNMKPPNITRTHTGSSSTTTASFTTAISHASAATMAGKKKPPPPPPKKKFLGGEKDIWVRALYTFEGQTAEDLSFREGERIKVVKKTESNDDWWEGEIGGRRGQFPANYCEMES